MEISEELRKNIQAQFTEFDLNDEEILYVAQMIAANSALYNSVAKANGKEGEHPIEVYPALVVNQVKLLVGTTTMFARL